ncbi:MAG: hypothetical protein HDS11_02210 [Bacteroides sp.]|nr:hypothetical protein [Bacteroides sp.]
MLPRCLSFLKSSTLSPGVRENGGPDLIIKNLISDDLNNIPNTSGVYIIVATNGTSFQYPNGTSPVMYIGMSEHLFDRIKSHADSTRLVNSQLNSFRCMNCQCHQRYHYFRTFGAKVFIFTRRGLQPPKSQEAIFLGKFYEKFLSLPVSNGARSFY